VSALVRSDFPVTASESSGRRVALVGGILLAAGESRRMGYPKPLLKLGSRTFIEILADAMLQSVARLIVVVGAHAEVVRGAIPAYPRIEVIENPGYLRGQLSSIKAALPYVGTELGGVLIHLADHPMVRAETFASVIEAYRRLATPIAIASYQGRRGHPVLFARELFVELAAAPEDQGARAVVAADPARVAYVDVDDPGILMDLDTPEDLERAGLGRPPRQT
jgi:molybdenum cofactor cytidylyltransferase